jgi:predicted nucleic acid-binding protein
MKLQTALSGVSVLAVDSPAVIYFIERFPAHVDVLRELFSQVDRGQIHAVSSVVTLTEVLTMPKRLGDSTLESKYRRLASSRNFALVPIDERIADWGATLRARHNLRTPDALQIAAGIVHGCQAFVTTDHGLRRVTELRVLVLDDLEL